MLNIFSHKGENHAVDKFYSWKKSFQRKQIDLKMLFFYALPVLVLNQEIREFQQRQREIEEQNSAQNVISFQKAFIKKNL